jgi:hypothetical protein
MVKAQIRVDDLTASVTGRLALNEYESNRVEITGLHLLSGGNPANMSFSDDSSSSSDSSYAKDSLELIRDGIRGRMNRRLSNDSYANDSVEVAKNKKLQNKLQIPKEIKLTAQQMNVKNIVIPSSVSPDLAGLKHTKISNHAA